jgi:hypothetical protein
LIINTPTECVIGGRPDDVRKLAEVVGRPFFPLSGVTLAHCDVGRPVEIAYHELHTLPVTPPKGVTVFSGAWGRNYRVTERTAADSITAGLLHTIDVPAVVESAYRSGVRVFVEAGPGSSCTRMIDAILGDRPHLARAAHAAKPDAVSQVLRLVANLAAERVRVDLGSLYGGETLCVGHRAPAAASRPGLVIPVGARPVALPEPPAEPAPDAVSDGGLSFDSAAQPAWDGASADVSPAIVATCDARVAVMQAHETFLRLNQKLTESLAGVIRFQTAILDTWMRGGAVALGSADSASRLTLSPLGPRCGTVS